MSEFIFDAGWNYIFNTDVIKKFCNYELSQEYVADLKENHEYNLNFQENTSLVEFKSNSQNSSENLFEPQFTENTVYSLDSISKSSQKKSECNKNKERISYAKYSKKAAKDRISKKSKKISKGPNNAISVKPKDLSNLAAIIFAKFLVFYLGNLGYVTEKFSTLSSSLRLMQIYPFQNTKDRAIIFKQIPELHPIFVSYFNSKFFLGELKKVSLKTYENCSKKDLLEKIKGGDTSQENGDKLTEDEIVEILWDKYNKRIAKIKETEQQILFQNNFSYNEIKNLNCNKYKRKFFKNKPIGIMV